MLRTRRNATSPAPRRARGREVRSATQTGLRHRGRSTTTSPAPRRARGHEARGATETGLRHRGSLDHNQPGTQTCPRPRGRRRSRPRRLHRSDYLMKVGVAYLRSQATSFLNMRPSEPSRRACSTVAQATAPSLKVMLQYGVIAGGDYSGHHSHVHVRVQTRISVPTQRRPGQHGTRRPRFSPTHSLTTSTSTSQWTR